MSQAPMATLVAAGRVALPPYAHPLLVVPVVAWIAFALRLFRLDAQNFWGDEAASYFFAKQSLSLLLQGLATAEPHPPLYYGLLHFLLPIAGREEYVLRFPSVFLGVTLVPLMYVLGRRLGGTALGCMAALLAALSPFQLWYSQEARHYMMVTALAAAATYLLLRLVNRPSLPRMVAYGTAVLLAAYAHYYALFLPIAHTVYLAFNRKALANTGLLWRRWALIQAVVGVLYLPWVVAASQVFFDYRKESPGELDLPALTWSFWMRQATGWSLDLQIAVPATLLLTCLLVGGGSALQQRGTLSLPLSWLLAPTLVPLVASLVRPMYQERYLFITSPAYLLILAAALVARGRGAIVAGTASLLALGVFGVSLLHLYDDPQFVKGEYAPLTRMVDEAAAPGDAVVLNGISQWYLYDYYRENDLPVYFLPPEQPLQPETIQAKLQEMERDHRGLWVIRAGVREYDPDGYVVNWLDTHYYRVGCQWARSGLGCYYRLPPASWAQERSLEVSFGDELKLLAFRADGRTMAADDVLAFELEMEALRPAGDHKLFVHLVDADGRLWGQNDSPPANGTRRSSELRAGERFVERRGLRPDLGVPPGSFTLLAGVYPESGGPRLALRPPSPSSPDTLVLGTVEIDAPSRAPLLHPPLGFRAANAAWSDGVRLLATRYPSVMGAGATASLRALWRVPGPLPGPRHALLTLVDGAGKRIGLGPGQPISTYASSQWGAGDLVAGDYAVTIPSRLPSGSYELALELTGADGQATPATARPLSTLGPVQVQGRERRFTRPFILHPTNQELGGVARLVGYEFDDQSSASVATLTLFWQAMQDGDRELKVFTHLVNEAGRVVAQHDSPPAQGDVPTQTWATGEFVTDRHPIALPTDLPSGTYTVKVGLYSPTSGQRLQTLGDRDAIDLLQVQW